MGHSSIVISLIAGPGLDGHTDGGHGTVVLQRRDGQAVGQSGDLQGLGLSVLATQPAPEQQMLSWQFPEKYKFSLFTPVMITLMI